MIFSGPGDVLELASVAFVTEIDLEAIGTYRSSDGGESWRSKPPGFQGLIMILEAQGGNPPRFRAWGIWKPLMNVRQGLNPMLKIENSSTRIRLAGRALGLAVLAAALFLPAVAAQETWARLPLAAATFENIVAAPAEPEVFYAVAKDQRLFPTVFRSDDAGRSWLRIRTSRFPEHRLQILLDETTPGRLHFLDGGEFLRSENGGTVATFLHDFGNLDVREIVADPSSPAVFYANTGNRGLFRSEDGGATWTELDLGLPLSAPRIIRVGTDPAGTGTVYAAVSQFDSGPMFGVFRSEDGGASWSRDPLSDVENLTTTHFHFLALGQILHARADIRLFRRVEAGGPWSLVGDGLSLLRQIRSDPSAPSVLYATTDVDAGLLRSLDGGATFAPFEPRPEGEIRTVAIDPFDGNRLLLGIARGGALRLEAGAGGWAAANDGLEPLEVTALVVDPRDEDRIFAGTPELGVFSSRDGGEGWAPASSLPFLANSVRDLLWRKEREGVLWVATADGVVSTRNSGNDWHDETFPLVEPDVRAVVFSASPRGVYLATDEGLYWRGDGFWELRFFSGRLVRDLVADPFVPTTLFAAVEELGVQRSDDGGITWQPMGAGLPEADVLVLEIDPEEPSRLYAGLDGSGLYRSLDGGLSFEVVAPERFGGKKVTAIAVDPADPSMIYVGTALSGMFRSRDRGQAFGPFSSGLGRTAVHDLAFSPKAVDGVSARIYAGTSSGVFAVEPRPRPTVLHLGESDRFRVEVTWRDFAGVTDSGRRVELPTSANDDSGLFYFFNEDNWELLVKVLDGCGINGHFWVFAAATTNVEYELRVTDTVSREVRRYHNPLGVASPATTDTAAFATCDAVP